MITSKAEARSTAGELHRIPRRLHTSTRCFQYQLCTHSWRRTATGARNCTTMAGGRFPATPTPTCHKFRAVNSLSPAKAPRPGALPQTPSCSRSSATAALAASVSPHSLPLPRTTPSRSPALKASSRPQRARGAAARAAPSPGLAARRARLAPAGPKAKASSHGPSPAAIAPRRAAAVCPGGGQQQSGAALGPPVVGPGRGSDHRSARPDPAPPGCTAEDGAGAGRGAEQRGEQWRRAAPRHSLAPGPSPRHSTAAPTHWSWPAVTPSTCLPEPRTDIPPWPPSRPMT